MRLFAVATALLALACGACGQESAKNAAGRSLLRVKRVGYIDEADTDFLLEVDMPVVLDVKPHVALFTDSQQVHVWYGDTARYAVHDNVHVVFDNNCAQEGHCGSHYAFSSSYSFTSEEVSKPGYACVEIENWDAGSGADNAGKPLSFNTDTENWRCAGASPKLEYSVWGGERFDLIQLDDDYFAVADRNRTLCWTGATYTETAEPGVYTDASRVYADSCDGLLPGTSPPPSPPPPTPDPPPPSPDPPPPPPPPDTETYVLVTSEAEQDCFHKVSDPLSLCFAGDNSSGTVTKYGGAYYCCPGFYSESNDDDDDAFVSYPLSCIRCNSTGVVKQACGKVYATQCSVVDSLSTFPPPPLPSPSPSSSPSPPENTPNEIVDANEDVRGIEIAAIVLGIIAVLILCVFAGRFSYGKYREAQDKTLDSSEGGTGAASMMSLLG